MQRFISSIGQVAPAITPVFMHLGLVLMIGLYIPPYLTRWFHEAARMLGTP